MTYPLKERLNAPLEQQESRRPTGTDRRILDAATEVFARHGFQGAKTLEIARTAGVSEEEVAAIAAIGAADPGGQSGEKAALSAMTPDVPERSAAVKLRRKPEAAPSTVEAAGSD